MYKSNWLYVKWMLSVLIMWGWLKVKLDNKIQGSDPVQIAA